MNARIALALVLLTAGCAADVGEYDLASAELRPPRACPAIAILCIEGYVPRHLPNCRWSCVPERGPECRTDEECTIYCITTPCPSGVCQGGRCAVQDVSACAAVLCAFGTRCEERGGEARCVPDRCGDGMSFDELRGECVCTAVARCAAGWSWDPVACDCIDPCAAVRCAAGTECQVGLDGNPVCAPAGGCIRTGCSGQICSDSDVITTCEWRDEYGCYADATCERQRNGACGWTQTPELTACLAGASDPTPISL